MGSSREESPDWLRCFQAPTQSVLTLSSGSESSPNGSPSREGEVNDKGPSTKVISKISEEDEDPDASLSVLAEKSSPKKAVKAKSPVKRTKAGSTPVKKKVAKKGNEDDQKASKLEKSEKHIEPNAAKSSVWTLSSDSESPGNSDAEEASKGKSSKKGLKKRVNNDNNKKDNTGDMEFAEGEIAEKHVESQFSSSQVPLMLSEKVSRSKVLVECEGDSMDLSGDVGSVGRVLISDNPSGSQEMLLDLKGTVYKTTIVPSRTFCVVSFGQSEAKIEAIMNDFVQLKPQSNVYEAETMVEGTLEGFSFHSEDEADKVPKANGNQTDQIEGTNGDQSNIKQKAKPEKKTKAEKTSGVGRKRTKAAAGKLPKKAKRKTQPPKKSRTKK